MKLSSATQTGVIGDRPTYGIAGRLYYASDEEKLYYDTGAAWTELSLGASVPSGLWQKFQITAAAVASPSTIDLTDIPQTYDDLELELLIRGAVAATGVAFNVTINNDTTEGNYRRAKVYFGDNGGSNQLTSDFTSTRALFAGPGDNATANYFSYAKIIIPLYRVAVYHNILCKNSDVRSTNTYWGNESQMLWLNTAAITRITISAADATNTLAIGSQARLYGWKAA